MRNSIYPAAVGSMPCEMTDVQWYTGLAMHAMIIKNGIPESPAAREGIAIGAFKMGEAMVRSDVRQVSSWRA
mgnify:CR=1 FL=1